MDNKELWISEETAQLILDAIAWSNKDWMDTLDWNFNQGGEVDNARVDFIRFCRARGIAGVERKVKI
jgi:hypothetical protein